MTRMRNMKMIGMPASCKASVIGCALVVLVLAGAASAQRSPAEEEPTAALSFLVIKDDNGKPVRSAAVIMHSVNTKGKQGRGDLELKTDADGKASFDEVPYGMLRVQVLASGFQTYGQDYEVNRPKLDLTIKLKRPQGQYSIYNDQPGEKKTSPPSDPNAKPQ
jgi:hypothetical protein